MPGIVTSARLPDMTISHSMTTGHSSLSHAMRYQDQLFEQRENALLDAARQLFA